MEKHLELNVNSVDILYRECLVNSKEIRSLQSGVEYVDITCPSSLLKPDENAVFATARIKENKEVIGDIIGQIRGIDHGIHFTFASTNVNGEIWTNQAKDVEKLILLGIASGCISYCGEKETWSKLPYGLPVIIKSICPQVQMESNTNRMIN